MVDSLHFEDISRVNELGSILNSKFEKLFHIDSLNNNEKIYVYKEDNKVYGFIHISINYEVVDLLNIVVDKAKRKQNIATLLMDYMIGDLPKTVIRILLEVDENNVEALKLYNKFNFQVISERNNYYGSNNAYVMEKRL